MRETCTRTSDFEERSNYRNGSRNDKLLDDVVRRSRTRRSLTSFRFLLADAVLSYWQRVHRFAEKTSNTSALSTSAGRFLYSVSVTLIAFVILWTSFIFAILSGSMLILTLLTAALLRCGRSARRAWLSFQTS